MAQQLQQAQIQAAQAKSFDIDSLGEHVLYKAASGAPLTPQEQAIGQAYDAKHNQVYTDSAGNVVSKPAAFGSLSGMMGQPSSQPPQLPLSALVGGQVDPIQGSSNATRNAVDSTAQSALGQNPNNPKLRQDILQKAINTKIERADKPFNQEEGQAATFYDRMKNSEQYLSDPKVVNAGTNPGQRLLSNVPLIGNALVSGDFQKLDQTSRDFINATLRRESGSAISPAEFDNAYKQYIPQYGDSKEKIELKAKNRQIVLEGMKRSAGTGYVDTAPANNGVVDYTEYFK